MSATIYKTEYQVKHGQAICWVYWRPAQRQVGTVPAVFEAWIVSTTRQPHPSEALLLTVPMTVKAPMDIALDAAGEWALQMSHALQEDARAKSHRAAALAGIDKARTDIEREVADATAAKTQAELAQKTF